LDRATLRRLSQRSDARGLVQLAAHAALLTLSGLLLWSVRHTAWIVPAIVAHGVVLDFLFCALHESIHRTAFKSRWLNDTVAWIGGALLILPAGYFRLFHMAHHRFTQDPAQDPELAQPPAATLASYLWRATGLPNWRKRISVTLRHALTGQVSEAFIPTHEQGRVVLEARLLWASYVAIVIVSFALQGSAALLLWILPAMAGQPCLRLYLMSEHAGCALTDRMYANTRTTYTNAVVRFITWQMPYHVEHHAFPAVPFHALGKVNELIRGRLEVSAEGYLSLHRTFIAKLRAPGALGAPNVS
jgi:fatty acid desaturase